MEFFGIGSSTSDPSIDRTTTAKKADGEADESTSSTSADGKDSVEISAEGAKLAAKESGDSDSSEAANSDGEDSDDSKPSASKAFVYGALGLERPEQTQNRETDGYDWGRWLAAGVTIGSIISVLV